MITYYFINYVKKLLFFGLPSKSGRNFTGRICIQGRGSKNKQLYRHIDLYRRLNQFGKVLKILKDPYRTGKIALIIYSNGLSSYLLIQKGIKSNDIIYSGYIYDSNIKSIGNGYSLPLKYIPLFSTISNVESMSCRGGSIARAAFVGCLLISKINKLCSLKLNSGWLIKLHEDNLCSLGHISSKYYNDLLIRKAGKNRALGWRPKVRGVAKNPCDHPHGGGNGKKSKPTVPRNAWSTVFKWRHTNNKKIDNNKRRLYKNIRI